MNADILIHGGRLLTLAGGRTEIINPGMIAVRNGIIEKAGPSEEFTSISAEKKIDASGCLVMPGLINCHNHAAMTLFRGLADDLPLMEWLEKHIFPAEARHVNPEMVYWCTKLAAAEMILSGTTTVADGYFHEDSAAQALADSGIRAVAAQGIIDFPAPGVPDPAGNIAHASGFLDKWQKQSSRVTPAVFCHSPYTCGQETLIKAKDLARSKGVRFFIHVAETAFEVSQIKESHGKSPVLFLDDLGILDDMTVCVHCVHLDAHDMHLLKSRGTSVVTCPESNMKLASGTAPVDKMISAEIPVALGTDGCASNNDLDMFREMDACAKIHKAQRMDPTVLPAGRILDMATLTGARVLGFEADIGSLEPGKKADIAILDLNKPHLTPFYNPDVLVYAACGADVRDVLIDGQLVMRDREILSFDVQETMNRVLEISRDIKGPI